MGHIFYEKTEIPIPPGGKLNHYDGYVSLYFKDGLGHRRRQVIGKATSETTMHANEQFKVIFPDLWELHYGQAVEPNEVHLGLYALTLGVGYKLGLYPIVLSAFGPLYGNGIMDYAMYSIEERKNPAQLFSEAMHDRMLFSRKVFSDSWLSRLFSEYITLDFIDSFRLKWLEICAQRGIQKVWLCIDGSNNDCDVKNSDLVDKGLAKSHQERLIVSYIWAVNAGDGMPITWNVTNGSMPDCKAIDEIIRLLGNSNIKVEGVILDRGFNSYELFNLIKSKGMKYIVMLKQNSNGFTEVMKNNAEKIRWKVPYVVNKKAIFGITSHCKVFANSQDEDCVALFFNGVGGACRAQKLIEKILTAYEQLSKQLVNNKYKIKIPLDLKQYLKVIDNENGNKEIEIQWDKYQNSIDGKGYYAIVSSDTLTAKQIYDLYQLRDVSEKQFSVLKSQLNGGTTRVHTDIGIKSRFAIAFVACIIRTGIQLACKRLYLDTNLMIKQSIRAKAQLMPNNLYEAIHNLTADLKLLMAEFDLEEGHITKFAQELNEQKASSVHTQVRTIPSLQPIQHRKPGPKPKKSSEEENNVPKRKPGRPKGSKNRTTVHQKSPEADQPPREKRKPGRPKGAKNKKTLEKEAELARQTAALKRGRGRPKGSLNKATKEKLEKEAELARQNQKRGPGRPRGSKNKPKLEATKTGQTGALDTSPEASKTDLS